MTNNSKAKVGLVAFSTRANAIKSLEHENFDAVNFGDPDGGTNLHDGLLKAQDMLNTQCTIPEAKKYVVVMSDGQPTFFIGDNDEVL